MNPICAMVKSRYIGNGMLIPPSIGKPYNGYIYNIHPYYKVNDHPYAKEDNGSLDPSTYGNGKCKWRFANWKINENYII